MIQKDFEGLLDYFDRNGKASFCRLELYRGKGACGSPRTVAVVTEVADNPGQSITNAAEEIATLITGQFEILPAELIYFEHYYPGSYHDDTQLSDSYAQVFFLWQNRRAYSAQWEFIDVASVTKFLDQGEG